MSSIMKNFADAEAVVKTANESAGSAEAEHEERLKSINGRLSILQSSFEELSTTVLNSDGLKSLIDFGTNLIQGLNQISKLLGGMPSLITPVVASLLMLNKKTLFTPDSSGQMHLFFNTWSKNATINAKLVQTAIQSSNEEFSKLGESVQTPSAKLDILNQHIKNLNPSLTKGVSEMTNYDDAVAKLNQNVKKTGTAFYSLSSFGKGVVSTFKSIGTTLANAVVSVGIGMLISGAISLISEYVQAAEKAKQKLYDDAIELDNKVKELKTTQEQIAELKSQLADSNISSEQAVSVRKQLYDIQKDLVEQYGTEANAIDLVRDSVDELNNSFDELSKKELEDYYVNNKDTIDKSIDNIFGANSIYSFGTILGNKTLNSIYTEDAREEITKIFDKVLDNHGKDYISDPFNRGDLSIRLGDFIKDKGGSKYDLIQIQNQLIEELENLQEYYVNNADDSVDPERFDEKSVSNVIGQLNDLRKTLANEDYNKQLEGVNKYAEYLISINDAESKLYNAVKFAKEDYENAIANGTEEDIKQAVSNYQNAINDIQTEIETLGSTGSDGAKKSFLQNIVDSANVTLAEDNYKLKFQANENGIKTSIENAIKKFNNGKEVSKEDILNFTLNENNKNSETAKSFEVIKNAADDAEVSLETYCQWLENLGVLYTTPVKESYNFTKILDMTADKMTSVKNKIDEIQSTFKTVKEVIEDYNDTGILSIDNAQKLIELGDDYINYLFDENGNLHINKQAYEDLTKAKVDEIKATLLKTAIDNIKQIKDEASAVEYLSKTTNDSTKATKDYTVAILENYYAQGMASGNEKVKKAVSQIYDTYLNYSKILDNVNTSYDANERETTSLTKGLEKQKEALEKSKKALEKQKEALENNKAVLEDLNDAYEKDKNYIEELVSLTVDMLKQRYEDEKDAIEKSKEAYRDKIDSLKEAIDDEEKLYERERDLADKNKNIATLEKQAASLTGTQSVEGIQRLSEISSDLEKARQELADTQRSNSVEDRQNAYDDEYNYREQIWDKEIEKLDEILKNERQLRLDAMALIDTKSQEFYNNLWSYVYKYTTKSRFEFNNLWNNAYLSLEKYGFGQQTCLQIMEFLERQIYDNEQAVKRLDDQIKILNGDINKTPNSIKGISDAIDLLDEKINDLKKSYDEATESKDRFLNTESKTDDTSDNKAKKEFDLVLGGGKTYKATEDSVLKASIKIYRKWLEDYNNGQTDRKVWNINDVYNALQNKYPQYASGTSYSKNGLAIVDEDGLGSEFILKKGRLDYLPEGSVVFNKDETNALKELANSKDKVKQILNNADYYDYFKSHINGTNSNMNLSDLNKTRDLLSGTLCKSNNEYNMPINIVVNNAQGLNENQLGKIIRKEFYQEIKKVQSWRG